MAILAKQTSTPRELIPADNYIARCYKMVQIGTVVENFQGQPKTMQKVRIGWELPTEMKVFKEENGPQPLVIEKEYTLSMAEKSNLRAMLTSWRGQAFTEDEAKAFDITKLIGAPCMLNVIHKPSKSDQSKVYEEISSITKLPKGTKCPDAINPAFILSYDEWDETKFDSLPDFIKDKMRTSEEYKIMRNPHTNEFIDADGHPLVDVPEDDLPF
jgi:hypothetical protein